MLKGDFSPVDPGIEIVIAFHNLIAFHVHQHDLSLVRLGDRQLHGNGYLE